GGAGIDLGFDAIVRRVQRAVPLVQRPGNTSAGLWQSVAKLLPHDAFTPFSAPPCASLRLVWTLSGAGRIGPSQHHAFCSELFRKPPAASASASGENASGSVGATPGISGGGGSGSGVCGNSSG